jgi:hypothetical protein
VTPLAGALFAFSLSITGRRFARDEPRQCLTQRLMTQRLVRPIPPSAALPSLLEESGRLRAFRPPFAFTSFFSPEDTLLCVIAAETAMARARSPGSATSPTTEGVRIVELTSGSGLIGLRLLQIERQSTLIGLDIDPEAQAVATTNARLFGLEERAQFTQMNLWSRDAESLLRKEMPQLLVCNPPYVPEPPGRSLAAEVGSGPLGTAHLERTLELTRASQPRALALSWCSLSDPEGVVRRAEEIGYRLNSLFVVVLADGEYSGAVAKYLKTLPTAFMADRPATLKIVAPDGSASFVFLLLAGDFWPERRAKERQGPRASEVVGRLCSRFTERGIPGLGGIKSPFPIRSWLLDRWDEVVLREFLHDPLPAVAQR